MRRLVPGMLIQDLQMRGLRCLQPHPLLDAYSLRRNALDYRKACRMLRRGKKLLPIRAALATKAIEAQAAAELEDFSAHLRLMERAFAPLLGRLR